MNFTIHFGWWTLPFVFSVIIVIFMFSKMDRSPTSGYGSIGQSFGNFMLVMASAIGVLVTWIIYFALSASLGGFL